MNKRHPDGPNSPEAQRLRRLREALEFDSSADFAKWLELNPTRWNNFENGNPLTRDVAMRLVDKIDGLSTDWLFRAKTGDLSMEMARKLGELPELSEAAKKPASRQRIRVVHKNR